MKKQGIIVVTKERDKYLSKQDQDLVTAACKRASNKIWSRKGVIIPYDEVYNN